MHGCGPSRLPCTGFLKRDTGSSPDRPSRPTAGWPDAFRPLDARTPDRWPDLAELRAGKITLLGLARDLGDGDEWEHADSPRLWRFHLHYWDWAWGLAADPDRRAARATFARLWRSWQSSARFAHPDAWHPYPAALRAWSWCGLHRSLIAGSDIEPEFVAGLATHARFLRRHLEYDVVGNHLIKDLKALVGLAIFLGDERLLRLAVLRLARQVGTQVLADGGHYERSPAYHCQVLADLIDVDGPAAGRRPDPARRADRGRGPDAALAGRGAHPRRAGAAAERRLPGRRRAHRRACSRARPRTARCS